MGDRVVKDIGPQFLGEVISRFMNVFVSLGL